MIGYRIGHTDGGCTGGSCTISMVRDVNWFEKLELASCSALVWFVKIWYVNDLSQV